MDFTLDTKYTVTHAWYEQLTGGFQRILAEPKAEKLHFEPNERRVIVEIGVYEGASSCWWSDNLLENHRSKLYCIDPFTGNEEYKGKNKEFPTLMEIEYIAKTNMAKSKHPGKITVLKEASWNAFSTLSKYLRDNSEVIDVLYIDGEHTSEAVCRDTALYAPLVRPGGAIIFDDYGHEDVKRGVDGALNALDCVEDAFYTGWQLWCIKK